MPEASSVSWKTVQLPRKARDERCHEELVNHWKSLTIPIDVGAAGVVAGRDRPAGRWPRWANRRAVRHDVIVLVVSCVTITEGDLAAQVMPRRKACCVAMRGGK